MRRSLFIASLLCTTALVAPERASAGPVIPFIAGAVGVSASTAVSLGLGAGYTAGAVFGGSLVGGFIVRTVIAVGLSLLASALTPKPATPAPSARMVNFAQAISYAETVYGRTRKGGPLGFTGFTDNRRYYVPILAAHEIEGIVEHWLDERVVTLNSETDQSLSNIDTAPIAGYGRINAFLGASGQTADAGLVAAFTEITSAHDFKGLAGAVIWAKRPPEASFTDVYPNGRQWAYAPVIDGKKVYDPRTATTVHSSNAALVLADWIVNVLGQSVNWTEVATEADVCDETVTNAESGTQSRWEINGTVSDDQDYETQRAQMAVACDAWIYERTDGAVGFKVGRWISPTVTLTDDDFFSMEMVEGNWGADAPSEVAITYTEPSNAWRETSSGVWVEDATVRRVRDEPQLSLITNHNQAARVAKRIAKTRRAKYQIKATLGMIGYELIGQRFIRVTHTEMGVDGYFEVGELTREGTATFTLTANSVNSTDFDFDAATEEPTRPSIGSVTNNDDIPDVADLVLSNEGGGVVRASWTAADDAYSQQVRIRPSGDTEWQVYTVPDGQDYIRIPGQADGTFEGQARNRTNTGRAGAWKPDTPATTDVAVNTTAPASLAAFTAAVTTAPTVKVDWAAPNDDNYAGVNIYRGATTTFASATLVTTEYGSANAAGTYSENLSDGTYYYWGEPINGSAVAGTASGPVTVVVASGP